MLVSMLLIKTLVVTASSETVIQSCECSLCTCTARFNPAQSAAMTIPSTAEPTPEPTAEPTSEPTAPPTAESTAEPTEGPTAISTAVPTAGATAASTAEPTATTTVPPTVKQTATSTAVPTSAPTEAPTAAKTVKDCGNWEEYDGNCYKFILDKKRWNAASKYCKDLDAQLVSIHSEDENNFVLGLIAGNRVSSQENQVLLKMYAINCDWSTRKTISGSEAVRLLCLWFYM